MLLGSYYYVQTTWDSWCTSPSLCYTDIQVQFLHKYWINKSIYFLGPGEESTLQPGLFCDIQNWQICETSNFSQIKKPQMATVSFSNFKTNLSYVSFLDILSHWVKTHETRPSNKTLKNKNKNNVCLYY